MAYIRQISEDEARGLLKTVYDGGRARAGAVANIVKLMSLDAPTVQSSMQLYTTVMKREGPLAPARREMLASVVSNVNACYY